MNHEESPEERLSRAGVRRIRFKPDHPKLNSADLGSEYAAEPPEGPGNRADETPPPAFLPDWIPAPNEDAVALAFASVAAGRAVFDHTRQCWFLWRNDGWTEDRRNATLDGVRAFARAVRASIRKKPPASLTRVAFARAVETFAKVDQRVAIDHSAWNTDPWLLGVPGGVVDLRTGIIRPVTPDLFINRRTSIAPSPEGAPHPLWSDFLAEATRGDAELQAYLQRLVGYFLTGDVTEEKIIFIHGPGGNGKGVFWGTILGVLADYALAVPIEVFTAGSRISLEYYRAKMDGARLVTASETEAGSTWSESVLKEMTGNEAPLSGRHPYGQPFNFLPQFKITIVGNHAPALKGKSDAMTRRLIMIPFTNKPEQADGTLKDRLRAERPAILRWAIDGCLMWQRDGLGTAAVIAAATGEYFEQQDSFGRWLAERCVMDRNLQTKPATLLADFNAWAKISGEEPLTANGFAEMIDATPGMERRKVKGRRWIRGAGLVAEQEWRGGGRDE